MFPEYKIVKVRMPHCPECGEQLGSENSYTYPYKCKCGIWERGWGDVEFSIKKDNK